VRVDHDALDDVVAMLEDDVRRFTADTREVSEGGHRVRDLAVVFFGQNLTDSLEIAALVVVERDAVDVLSELLLGGRSVVLGTLVLLE